MKKIAFSLAVAGVIIPMIAFVTSAFIWVQRSIATPVYGIEISYTKALEIDHDKLAEMFSEVVSFYHWLTQLNTRYIVILMALVIVLSMVCASLSLIILKKEHEKL